MINFYWYFLLGIIGLLIAVFAFYNKHHITEFPNLIVFYLFSTCVPWIGEFVVLGMFDSYTYRIDVFTNQWAQNLFAHLILNSTLWPASATLVAAYSLGYGWISLIAGANTLIEYLFVSLRIYEQHWWRYYMTFFAVFIYLAFSKIWFGKMNKIRHGIIRNTTLYFAAFVALHYPIPIMLLAGKQYYNANWAPDMFLSSIRFIFVYQLAETFILILFICVLKKWYWKLVPYITAVVGQGVLQHMNILVFQDRWNFFYLMFFYYISITAVIFMHKLTLKPSG